MELVLVEVLATELVCSSCFMFWVISSKLFRNENNPTIISISKQLTLYLQPAL